MVAEKKEIQNAMDWILEKVDPGVRYLALRDLCRDEAGAVKDRRRAHADGPIAVILEKMKPEGYWVAPGAGYSPKYTSTIWSVIHLAQLGGSIREDKRIGRACEYLLGHSYAAGGQFSLSGAPSGTVDCLQGNLCWALAVLGCEDKRLDNAFDWLSRSVTGEGIAPADEKDAERRFFSAKCGPGFACGYNYKKPCAWGAVKVLRAISVVPARERSSGMKRALEQGAQFLFSVDPATASYPSPTGGKPSPNWWKFGFPVFYITDILQTVEVLSALGFGEDRRLESAVRLIEGKRNKEGKWLLEYDYSGKCWVNYGAKGKPNKWVTLRALRGLGITA
jgi:hypothetical protein